MEPIDFSKAQRHLARRDPVLKKIIRATGPCTLQHDPDGFGVLARSILSQQISTKAARAITERLLKALGRRGLKPRSILALEDEVLRGAGLSASKTKYLRDLAQKCHQGDVKLDQVHTMTDDEVVAHLTPVCGIGVWTAEMFLMFSLGRPDVLPVGDYGLRSGVQRHYELADLPNAAQLRELAESWRPYRSIGTWYIWRGLGAVPQSE